ncbi:zinc finger protein 62-like [Oppia nitens]|uniref:zinc finger protein 62-like n=1 Tax=Oppia nitens TaxID=1686743 RepID=UPI0023D9EE90|nr:zinc finger protein 62-like [Oppia nitens]
MDHSCEDNDDLNQTTLRPTKRVFECDVCHQVFTRNTSLTEHKHIHTNCRPFECHVCGKTFRQTSNLKKHQKLHDVVDNNQRTTVVSTNAKTCDICGKQFPTKSSLKSHRLSHDDYKSCLCDKCGQTFKYRSDLIRHMKIHDNRREYECNVCAVGFNDRSALKRHRLKLHKTIDNNNSDNYHQNTGQTLVMYETRVDTDNSSNSLDSNQLSKQMSADLNDRNYINSVIDYIDVCRILPVPLPNHIFEKLVEIQKQIQLHLGTDRCFHNEYFSLLLNGQQELNQIIVEHLRLVY